MVSQSLHRNLYWGIIKKIHIETYFQVQHHPFVLHSSFFPVKNIATVLFTIGLVPISLLWDKKNELPWFLQAHVTQLVHYKNVVKLYCVSYHIDTLMGMWCTALWTHNRLLPWVFSNTLPQKWKTFREKNWQWDQANISFENVNWATIKKAKSSCITTQERGKSLASIQTHGKYRSAS